MEPNDSHLCWIDTETTGLDPSVDALLEIAVVVTTNGLKVVDAMEFVIRHDPARLPLMSDYVQEMHRSSGLLASLPDGVPVHEVEPRLTRFLDRFGAPMVVAGNSVGFDRAMLDAHMPGLNRSKLHYRNVDVSTIKELARRWNPKLHEAAPQKRLAHRAMADIHESIDELRGYLASGFIG